MGVHWEEKRGVEWSVVKTMDIEVIMLEEDDESVWPDMSILVVGCERELSEVPVVFSFFRLKSRVPDVSSSSYSPLT